MTTVPARYLPLLILLVLFGCSDESTEIESASGPQTGPLMPLLVPDPLSVEAVAALVSDIRGPAYALHFNDEESLYKSPTVMSTYAFPDGGLLETQGRVWSDEGDFGNRFTETSTYRDGLIKVRRLDHYPSEWTWASGEGTDGSTLSGGYNLQFGNFRITTTYPEGNDPISCELSYQAEVLDDKFIEVEWLDGRTDLTTFFGPYGTIQPETWGRREYRDLVVDFFIEAPVGEVSVGTWTRSDGVAGELELIDGIYGMWTMAFRSTHARTSDVAAISGSMNLEPGGTGVGVVTATCDGRTAEFKLRFSADGKAVLSAVDGTSASL